MKRLLFYTFIAIAFFSCVNIQEDSYLEDSECSQIDLEYNQILCGTPAVKTSLDAELNVIWSKNDKIQVFASGSTAIYQFATYGSENKKYAVFECSGQEIPEGEKSAIYPASAYIADSYDGNKVDISLGGITEIPLSSDGLSEESDIYALPMVATPSGDVLTFANLFGGVMFRPHDHIGLGVKIVKLSISAVDGRELAGTACVNLLTGKAESFSGTETTLTYTCQGTDISKSGMEFIAYLPAGEYAQGITLTAIDNLGRKFPLTTTAITINAGSIKKLPEVDLSIYYGSANSIIVEPGTTSISIDVTPRYTWRNDYDITAGKPIRVENGNLSHYGKDAKVVWQQEENCTATDLTATNTTGTIISDSPSISFNDTKGTATLTVPLTGTKGNAVVSICYGSAVAWSYHIWVCSPEDKTLGGRTFMDRNLGAVSITPGDRDSYGLCYQWGRKDPFPRILTDNDTDVSGHKSHGDLLKTIDKGTGGTIAYTIKNPDTRITSAKSITCQNGDHWFNSEKDIALWGCKKSYGNSSEAKTDGTSIKTIFDPCPKGYKVPTYGDLTACISGTLGSTTKGRTIDDNYFPFGGFIRLEESFISSGKTGWMTDSRGYLWSSICRNGNDKEQGAYILKYNKDLFNNNNGSATDINGTGRGDQIFGFMCDAYPIRCVKEESSGTGSDLDEIQPPVLEEGEVLLNTAFDINLEATATNSHSGLEKYSVLQPMYNNIFKLENSVLTAGVPSEQQKANYPRIKRRKDGGVVLFYQGGTQSSRIFSMNAASFNGLKNATPQVILKPYVDSDLTATYGKTVYQRYMNMDAVVMPDGEIIGVVQHHAWDYKDVGYYQGQGTAIELIRSNDGGKTWTTPEEIYSGTAWEPYLLLLPDGKLQLYFTDSNPFLYSSQTSVMTSSDKGHTWSAKKIAARRYKYLYDGQNTDYHGQYVYTDQMPCFRLLNDGKTLAGFIEGRLEKENSLSGSYTSYHKMSLIKNNGTEWPGITGDSQNALPTTRETDKMTGTGGYIETFPSGETVISCSSNGPFIIKILDSVCTTSDGIFNINNTWDPEKWFQPFGETGVWGAMERYNDNILMATASDNNTGLDLGLFYLNQQLTAKTEAIMLDGMNDDWTTDKALFLSSPQGTEMILRFAHDDDNLYLLCESCHMESNEDISISIKPSSYSKSTDLSLSSYGELSTSSGVIALVRKGKTYDSRKGFCMEASIPLSTLGISPGNTIFVYATVGGTAFTSAETNSVSNWQRVKIQ